MSLSCADIEAMDLDELIDAITGLSQNVGDMDAEIGALRNRYDRRASGLMETASDLQDRVDELEDEVDPSKRRTSACASASTTAAGRTRRSPTSSSTPPTAATASHS